MRHVLLLQLVEEKISTGLYAPLRVVTLVHTRRIFKVRLGNKRILAVARMVFVCLICPKKLVIEQDGMGS